MNELSQRAEIAAAKARGCSHCGRVIPQDERARCYRRLDVGFDVVCVPCLEKEQARHAEEEKRRDEAERRRRLREFDQSFSDSCVGAELAKQENLVNSYLVGWEGADVDTKTSSVGPLRFPKWKWARFENAAFRQRADARVLEVVEDYDCERDGSLVLCGKTGSAKSSSVVAWIWQEHDALRTRVAAGEKLRFDFAWVSGFELAGARKRSQLGDEAPLVKHASAVALLVLDDVGCEPKSEETFVVLDARYRAQLATIVTSPLEPAALIGHLGGGGYRRALEHGRLVEAFGEAPKAKAGVRVVR